MDKNEIIILSVTEERRLRELLPQVPQGRLREFLAEELARARVLPDSEVPRDVVTLNSRVRFCDESSGRTREALLVPPGAADASAGRISVLSPVGIALLGLTAGQSIAWPAPEGGERMLKILRVETPVGFPEARSPPAS